MRKVREQVTKSNKANELAGGLAGNGDLIKALLSHELDSSSHSGVTLYGDNGLEMQIGNGSALVLLLSLGLLGEGGIVYEAVVLHPVVINELGDVRSHRVREDDNHSVVLGEVLGDLKSGSQSRARRSTHKQTLLLDESSRQQEGLSVLGLDPRVDHVSVQNVGHEVVTDTLDLVALVGVVERLGDGQNGALGVSSHNNHVLVLGLESLGNTGDGSSGSGASDEMGHLTLSLLPDLGTSAVEVSVGVGLVSVLIENDSLGDLLLQTSGNSNVGLGASQAASVGVRTISAPRALSTDTFSLDIFSGRVMMVL